VTFIHHDGFHEIAPEDSPTELAHLADLADKGFNPQSLSATAAREGAPPNHKLLQNRVGGRAVSLRAFRSCSNSRR